MVLKLCVSIIVFVSVGTISSVEDIELVPIPIFPADVILRRSACPAVPNCIELSEWSYLMRPAAESPSSAKNKLALLVFPAPTVIPASPEPSTNNSSPEPATEEPDEAVWMCAFALGEAVPMPTAPAEVIVIRVALFA